MEDSLTKAVYKLADIIAKIVGAQKVVRGIKTVDNYWKGYYPSVAIIGGKKALGTAGVKKIEKVLADFCPGDKPYSNIKKVDLDYVDNMFQVFGEHKEDRDDREGGDYNAVWNIYGTIHYEGTFDYILVTYMAEY